MPALSSASFCASLSCVSSSRSGPMTSGSMPAASSSSSVASSFEICAPRPSSMRTAHGACRCCRGLAAARRCGCSAAVACSRPSSSSARSRMAATGCPKS
eukprot:scaffold100165_cov44-Phaeocystis_antarctica.AAC.3